MVSWQWIIGELACYTYSMVAVPLYDTLGPEAIVFIINQGNLNSSCTIMLIMSLSPVRHWCQLGFMWTVLLSVLAS